MGQLFFCLALNWRNGPVNLTMPLTGLWTRRLFGYKRKSAPNIPFNQFVLGGKSTFAVDCYAHAWWKTGRSSGQMFSVYGSMVSRCCRLQVGGYGSLHWLNKSGLLKDAVLGRRRMISMTLKMPMYAPVISWALVKTVAYADASKKVKSCLPRHARTRFSADGYDQYVGRRLEEFLILMDRRPGISRKIWRWFSNNFAQATTVPFCQWAELFKPPILMKFWSAMTSPLWFIFRCSTFSEGGYTPPWNWPGGWASFNVKNRWHFLPVGCFSLFRHAATAILTWQILEFLWVSRESVQFGEKIIEVLPRHAPNWQRPYRHLNDNPGWGLTPGCKKARKREISNNAGKLTGRSRKWHDHQALDFCLQLRKRNSACLLRNWE